MIDPFVLDASATLGLVLTDEFESEALENAIRTRPIIVPAIWPLEVVNALLMAERRKRLTGLQLREMLKQIQNLPVRVEPASLSLAMGDVLRLANRYALSLYDACYLELADRLGASMASHDKALRRAAEEQGLRLL